MGTIKRASKLLNLYQTMRVSSWAATWCGQPTWESVSKSQRVPPQLNRKSTTTRVFRIVHASDKLNVLRISTAKEQEGRCLSLVGAERKESE
jgi:hypothetical protein